MLSASGSLRGAACQDRPRPGGQGLKAHVPGSLQHGPNNRLTSIAAAAVAVRSLPQQQASSKAAGPDSTQSSYEDVPTGRAALPPAEQQVLQLQISGAQPVPQQERLQQHNSSSQDSSNEQTPSAAVLGSRPGVVWHVRRNSSSYSSRGAAPVNASSTQSNGNGTGSSKQKDWNVTYAAAAILDAFGSMDLSGGSNSGSRGSSTTSSAQATLEENIHLQGTEQEASRQDQLLQQDTHQQGLEMLSSSDSPSTQQPQQEPSTQPAEDIDFMLLERIQSHAQASTSSRSSHSSSDDTPEQPLSGTAEAAAAPLSMDELLFMQQGPAANFRDPRFEMAISRWIKEAPDWFKVRTVYERFGWRFNIVNLSCAVSKLATLLAPISSKPPLRKEQAALQRFLQEILSAVGELNPSVDAGTAAAILLGYSRLLATKKVRRNPQLVASLLENMRPQLASLQPRELAGCLWALKTLEHKPPDDWMQDLYEQTVGIIPKLKPEETAVLLRGLGGVQAAPPNPSWLSAVLSHAQSQLEWMEPKQLSMMLMGLAYMQVRPSRSWMEAAMSALQSKFDQMGPQALANILWALAKMGCLPDRPWLNSYFSTTLQLLNSMNALELSMDMWSVNGLKLEPSDEWLDEYFDESEAKLSKFTLQNLALCGYSLAKLGLRPPQTWLRRYCTLLLRFKGGLWKNKRLLTQVLVALDSFKLPRMDMWRRELYAAAGYKLYKYPDWRQRVKVMPSPLGPYSTWPYSSRRRFGRRGLGVSRSGSPGGLGGRLSQQGSRDAGVGVNPNTPVALRSGDWGIMDGMGGGRGVMGSVMSSYEELGNNTSSVDPPVRVLSSNPGNAAATGGSLSPTSTSSMWGSRQEGSSSSSTERPQFVSQAAGRGTTSSSGLPAGAAQAAANSTASPNAAGKAQPGSMLTSRAWTGSRSPAVSPRRPLNAAGLVRPPPPPAVAVTAGGKAAAVTPAGQGAAGRAAPTAAGPASAATSAAVDGVEAEQAAAVEPQQQQQQGGMSAAVNADSNGKPSTLSGGAGGDVAES